MSYIYFGSLAFIFITAVWLILDRRYDDGFIGRIALGIMAFASFFVLFERCTTEVDRHIANTTVFLTVAFAIFMLRHVLRHLCFGRKRRLADGSHVHA